MANKGIFNDPIAPKMRKSSKNFAAPTKDQLYTDYRFQAGDDYGSGFRNPEGKMRGPSSKSPVPKGCFKFNV